MQKVICKEQILDYSDHINGAFIDYITEGQVETYESFEQVSIAAFDWYNVKNIYDEPSRIMIYFNRDDLFIICENEKSYQAALSIFISDPLNEHAMYLFFRNLLIGNTEYLENMESIISDLDNDVIDGTEKGLREKIVAVRNEVLRVKKYYEQIEFLLGEICDNDNDLISNNGIKLFEVLHSRINRFISQANNLREYITQVRESYQSQIGLEQNNLMKIFTLVTSIFMPLTLIVGWYGMNFKMPEFTWTHGYLFVVGLCAVVCFIWIIIFKKAKWFR